MFEKHSSIISIKNTLKHQSLFEFQPIAKDTLKETISNLDQTKACGYDMINARYRKLSVDIIAGPLLNMLNKCTHQGTFPTLMKMAAVSPGYTRRKTLSTRRTIDQSVS